MDAQWTRWLPALLKQRLHGRVGLQAVVSNAGWLLADKLFRMVLGVLVGAWVARYLGPARFGELSYVIALVAIFQIAAKLGLDGIAVRDIARSRADAPEILGTAFRLRVAAGLVAWGLALISAALLRPGDTRSLLLVALIGVGLLLQAGDTIDLWFQSQIQSRRTVTAKALSYLIASGLRVAAVLAGASIAVFAATSALDAGLASLFLLLAYAGYKASGKWRWSGAYARSMLGESWPLLLSGLSIMVYMRIDQVMLRTLAGEAELGYFSAALPLSEAWAMIPAVITTSLAATFASLRQQSEERYLRALRQLFQGLAWAALVIAILMALISPLLVRLLYGPAFERSALVLSIHVFSIIPIFLGMAQGLWIINERMPRVSLYKTVVGALASLALNFALIPRFGAVGAAVSAVTSQLLSAVLANLVLCPQVFRLQMQAFVPRIS